MGKREYPVRVGVSKLSLHKLKQGQKTMFVAVDNRIFAKLLEGSIVIFCTADHSYRARIIALRRYNSLERLLAKEEIGALALGTMGEALAFLQRVLPTPDEHQAYVVLEIEGVPRRKKKKTGRSHD